MAEIGADDTNVFCLVPLFEDYRPPSTHRQAFFSEAAQDCSGYLSDDGMKPVCSVNRPSAPSRPEKCGRQALWEHKLNSQAHFEGRHVEGQTPDEPLKQFHIKSTDAQIFTMICQVSAEFTGAGIAEFHTTAPSPRSPWQERVIGNICVRVCVYVCVSTYTFGR